MIKLFLLGIMIYGVYQYFNIANRLQSGADARKQVKEKRNINIEINIDRKKAKEEAKEKDYTDFEEIK